MPTTLLLPTAALTAPVSAPALIAGSIVQISSIANLRNWFSGRSGVSTNDVTPADGAVVARWRDLVSLERASQDTAGGQPLYDEVYANGRPGLVFTASDDLLVGGLSTAGITPVGGMTMFVVGQFADANRTIVKSTEANTFGAVAGNMAFDRLNGLHLAGCYPTSGFAAGAVNALSLYSATYDSAANQLINWFNGALRIPGGAGAITGGTTSPGTGVLTPTLTPAVNASPLYIGNRSSRSLGVAGTFAEILIFARELTTDERQAVEGQLALDYDMTDILSTAHPYYNA